VHLVREYGMDGNRIFNVILLVLCALTIWFWEAAFHVAQAVGGSPIFGVHCELVVVVLCGLLVCLYVIALVKTSFRVAVFPAVLLLIAYNSYRALFALMACTGTFP
jgi:hypothetical protein